MKKKMQWKTVTAAAVLTLTLAGQSFAATSPFQDVKGTPAEDKINVLFEQGVIKGISDDKFAPGAVVTAAQGVQLIVNALDLNLDLVRFVKEPLATDYFKHADNKAWYAQTLIIAAVNNLELPADLKPTDKWTREEFTHQLISAIEQHANLPEIKLAPVEVKDQELLTPEYDGSLQRALAYGVVKLDEAGKFNPKAELTRGEAAEQIYNALEYIKAHPAPESLETDTEPAAN
ncbi:S-layer homology domain-containing protein [Paenibacillus sp. GCM10023252]|uniref:S-layer homology domain-containing protein n=1 Tax=Paenibacillus sp. GCM10023252 TaxID=3252649 RepID=UPI003614B064